jgi:hypothetical protein
MSSSQLGPVLPARRAARRLLAGARWLLPAAAGLALTVTALPEARGQSCTSSDPSQWPAPSKPYFMLVVDTSGSMGSSIATGTNSCGYQHNRIGDARCAVRQTIQAFSGEVNFGLATYAWKEDCTGVAAGTACPTCSSAFPYCYGSVCNRTFPTGDDVACGPITTDGNLTATLNTTNNSGNGGLVLAGTKQIHAGGMVAVPLVQDNFWSPPLNASNFSSIFSLVDNDCGNAAALGYELGGGSNTPLGGSLFNMNQYFSGTYHDPFTAAAIASPIGPATFAGLPAERACRSINVILITDGDETCDQYNSAAYPTNEGLAVFEAGRLFNPGVTVSGQTFPIKTYVIGFVGATITALDHIASAGGTTASYSANNETQLSQALANIIGGSIKPETCNNTDDNCNGCVDEGFVHYCDVQNLASCCSWKTPAQKTACGATACACCNWGTAAERTTCLGNYTASITAANPKGDVNLLPCTTAAQAQSSATWLCYDPGDVCDNLDNNCVAGVDEGANKCGSPLHCPQTETCNGQDDNCNGLVDEGNVCTSQCAVTASAEVCDGCDNDCDGLTDNGLSVSIPCGFTGPGEPAYCAGTITCKAPVAVPKGTCAANGGFTACTFPAPGPSAEVCDNLDNDCNGIIDDNIATAPCVPTGTPPGLIYGGTSQCKKGTTQCINGATVCVGFVGPSAEVCDGIDNNCDGTVDNGLAGLGQPCGVNQAPCTPGTTACVAGALTCTGGVQPKPEVCNGVDDDCNGMIDDGALADAPGAGMNGCWDLVGTCCQFPAVNPTLHWCPPPGGNCTDNGTLSSPCNHGSLTCLGGGWTCKGPKDPGAEVCDGIDNDCNGAIDDGVMNVGTVCGTNVGECKQGLLQCQAGVLSCVGGVFPIMELCDGKDNDCDGTVDNGITTGGACTMPYDTVAFPGQRDKAPCKPGVLQCDGNGGLSCVGGVAPSAELCDGVDNDCDGQIDEVGAAPDGINGSANPIPPPAANIGDTCGVDQGACQQGAYACLNGQFTCLGGQGAKPEECDCQDNDCDGKVDNQTPNAPPICGTGKDCVKSSFGCGCAVPCNLNAEFPCPGGQVCQDVTVSESGVPAGKYCVSDPCGGDCTGKTVTDASNKVICAPPGTPADPMTCAAPPVCVCKGQFGCKDPCAGVTCGAGTVCAALGTSAGKCVADSCFANPCQGCGKVCNLGSCVSNPCDPDPCKSDEECKPSADFSGHACVPTCGGKTCPAGQACVLGACVDTCAPACASGQVCDRGQTPPGCVTDKCQPSPCTDGSFCDPVTGGCGNDPCAGVVCPTGDACQAGTCVTGQGGTGGAASSSSSSSTSSSGTGGHAQADGGPGDSAGIWGLATGGGGCSCEVGPGVPDGLGDARFAFAALAIALGARRRPRRSGEKEVAS